MQPCKLQSLHCTVFTHWPALRSAANTEMSGKYFYFRSEQERQRTCRTNLKVVGINPLGLCINWVSERSTVGMVDEEGHHLLLHHLEVLSERMSSRLWPDLWLEEAGLGNHGVVSSAQFCQLRLPATD